MFGSGCGFSLAGVLILSESVACGGTFDIVQRLEVCYVEANKNSLASHIASKTFKGAELKTESQDGEN